MATEPQCKCVSCLGLVAEAVEKVMMDDEGGRAEWMDGDGDGDRAGTF